MPLTEARLLEIRSFAKGEAASLEKRIKRGEDEYTVLRMAASNLEKNRSMWRTELSGVNLSNSRKLALNNVKADVDR